jgi:hypothetical protein
MIRAGIKPAVGFGTVAPQVLRVLYYDTLFEGIAP